VRHATRQIGVGEAGGFVGGVLEERTPRSAGSVTPASLTFVDCFARLVLFGDHQAATVSAVGFIHSTA